MLARFVLESNIYIYRISFLWSIFFVPTELHVCGFFSASQGTRDPWSGQAEHACCVFNCHKNPLCFEFASLTGWWWTYHVFARGSLPLQVPVNVGGQTWSWLWGVRWSGPAANCSLKGKKALPACLPVWTHRRFLSALAFRFGNVILQGGDNS